MFDKNVFGSRLAQLRRGRGLSQTDLGKLLGVSQAQISDMERGNSTTSMARLWLLCDYFQVSADYLMGLTDDPGPKSKP